jgi:hypothetical protein
MPQIQIGSLVLAQGERLLRRVLAIKDDQARCQQVQDGSARWYALSQLSPETPNPPLKTYLL